MNKVAVFGLDLEDWYHLDYIHNHNKKTAQFSMLDGFDNYINIFNNYNIKFLIISYFLYTLTKK